ncbi:hypothetical protein MRB53_033567 [Persea americana]|uniref:Uncharacterized protein n=1 Tax=Persea americana TaxID=3435 RepID=A0ACC2KW34_PERAE|nr:hypothetical protein MRB53_033567 [Persea americana]
MKLQHLRQDPTAQYHRITPSPQNKITVARTPENTDPATAILFNAGKAALSAGGLVGDSVGEPEGEDPDFGGLATEDGVGEVAGAGVAGGGDGGERELDGDGDFAGGVDFGDGTGLADGGEDIGAGVRFGGEAIGDPVGDAPGACPREDPTITATIATIATKLLQENLIFEIEIEIVRDLGF